HEAATARLKNRSDESSQRLRYAVMNQISEGRTSTLENLPQLDSLGQHQGKIVMAHMESVTETATAIYEAMAI
ncbi:hypothetical protein PMAYCL1PPCAC_11659, partial [Pristionchus mayeri]